MLVKKVVAQIMRRYGWSNSKTTRVINSKCITTASLPPKKTNHLLSYTKKVTFLFINKPLFYPINSMFESIPETTESTLEANDRQLWLKALSSIQQNNEAYAVNLLLPVVTNNPGFLEARKTLRKCQAVAAGSKSSGGTKVFGLSIGGGSKGASSKTKSLAKRSCKGLSNNRKRRPYRFYRCKRGERLHG